MHHEPPTCNPVIANVVTRTPSFRDQICLFWCGFSWPARRQISLRGSFFSTIRYLPGWAHLDNLLTRLVYSRQWGIKPAFSRVTQASRYRVFGNSLVITRQYRTSPYCSRNLFGAVKPYVNGVPEIFTAVGIGLAAFFDRTLVLLEDGIDRSTTSSPVPTPIKMLP